MSVPKDKRTEGELTINTEARRTHAGKGNSYKLIQRMDEYYKTLWVEGVKNGTYS